MSKQFNNLMEFKSKVQKILLNLTGYPTKEESIEFRDFLNEFNDFISDAPDNEIDLLTRDDFATAYHASDRLLKFLYKK